MRCGKCGRDNREGRRFCAECGVALAVKCGRCGASNEPDEKFCGECGTALAAHPRLAAPEPQPAPAMRFAAEESGAQPPDGERKTITALFADIKGSMELMEDLDPEEARAIVDPALRLMIDAVHRYDGYIVQSTGDGIFALFGAPVAHEDHPQRALYAALRMQDEIGRYSGKLREAGNPPIEARVGVNTGEAVVRSLKTADAHTEYTPIGHSTSLAARMQTLAPSGSIAVTETTEKLCAGYFSFKALGPSRVKGVSEPVHVFEVTGLGPLRTRLQRSAGRGLTKFVGRQAEMEAMGRAAELAKEGHGQLVAAIAEAGVGKSRLLYEFKATSQSGWIVLETFSVSHGKASAYLPVIDLLRNYFRIGNEDDERTRREKVTGRVVALDRNLEDTLPYLFALLGIIERVDPLAQMDGQIKRRRTLDAIKRIILRESLNQPLMVICEDLHWMDAESLGLLNLLADSIANACVLLLVNYRPEYRHEWGNKTYYTQLRLDPLGKQSAEEMLTALLTSPAPAALSAGANRERSLTDIHVGERVRGRGGLEELKRLIIDKTEGNPFFMEEMVQNLFEEGALVRNGEVKLARPLSAIRIPPMVQAILAARIDRLPPEDKDLLQTLAVLGKQFTLSEVKAAAAKSDSELERMLSGLQLAEFIHEQPATGDIEYTFKHALTQEVAYNSILVERRKQIHERAAQAIESLFAASLADHYKDLARHYQRSGNALKAVHYLHLAAQQAMTRSAYSEANTQLTAALELLRTQPEDLERDQTELAVRLGLAICVMISVSDFYTATAPLDNLERARELCEKVGDEAIRFEVLQALAYRYNNEQQKARPLSEEVLRIALRLNDPEMVRSARSALGLSSMMQGNFIAAIKEFEQADQLSAGASPKSETTITVLKVSGNADRAKSIPKGKFSIWGFSTMESANFVSWTLWLLGYPERAMAGNRESFALAREITTPSVDLAVALWGSTFFNLLRRDWKTAYAHADEAGRLVLEHGLISVQTLTTFTRGWALAKLGRIEEGLSEVLRCLTEFMQTSGTVINPWIFSGVADVYLAAGRPREGLEAVGKALELVRRTGTEMLKADLHRLKGELLLMGDNSAAAEAARCFRDAINVAGRQSAKSFQLRATTSLARLLAGQNRRDEARQMLAEIYGWFTEGFDTADVKDAKALLDELAQ
jgi:class 3 adenylate cyclase/tetratricopeptide (TPR) repeat protein